MKKIILTILAISAIGLFASIANAQMMGRFSNSSADWNNVVEHTLQEEKEGKELWDKFQAKEVVCTDLSDEQFGVLGEYFMGQMMGDSHAAMNGMMIQTHSEDGEAQIHIVMGKRLSGCDTSASTTAIDGGWMPMMNMMSGGWSSPVSTNGGTTMMNFGYGSFGAFGWIFMILWWALIIAGIVALVRWLMNQSGSTRDSGKTALAILKERYAKGEIDQKEFEEKKKDLE